MVRMKTPTRITEVKRHIDGSRHRFECELVAMRPHLAIVLFRHWRERSAGGFRLPRGSRTYGFFWRCRPYSLYRMVDARGRLIAHRYDVLDDVRLSEREISYLDLFLDIWVAPNGDILIEDEDAVENAAWLGLLSRPQQRRIARARDLIVRRYRAIEREAAQFLARLRT